MNHKGNEQQGFLHRFHHAGRMVKYKGVAASIAPFDAATPVLQPLFSGTQALLSIMALSFALSVSPLGGRNALAGSCTETSAGIWNCTGAVSTEDVEQSLSSTMPLKITIDPTFGISTNSGNAFTLESTGGLSFSDVNGATITGGEDGIYARNSGGGALTIKSSGSVKGESKGGIDAENTGTDLTIEAATVNGNDKGIRAVNNGGGALTITATGDVTAALEEENTGPVDNDGIYAKNSGTDLTINAVGVKGPHDGIDARNTGTGALTIKATGTVTGTNDQGIYAENRGTDTTIELMDVNAHNIGMFVDSAGTGDLNITARGTVTSQVAGGIVVNHAGKNLTIDVDNVTGGGDGIEVISGGEGETKILTRGDVAGKGSADKFTGFGILAQIFGGTGLVIETHGKVTADEDGIYAQHESEGPTHITVKGDVQGGVEGKDGDAGDIDANLSDHGIEVVSNGDAAVDIGAKITKGNDDDSQAVAMQAVRGMSTLILRGGWELVGQAESAASASDRLVLVADGLAGEALDLGDIGDTAKPNAILGFVNLVKQGDGNWQLTGTQTAGNFASGQVEAGTLTLDSATLLMMAADTPLKVLEGATLSVNGPSTINGSLESHGTVTLVNGTAGDVLHISGDYNATSALLLETVLEGDASASDLLQITGNASGVTNLTVVNLGGVGAQTVVGIPLVTVGGESNATFVLVNGDFVSDTGEEGLIAGAYAYRLIKTSEGNWALTSEQKAVDPQVPVRPTVRPSPGLIATPAATPSLATLVEEEEAAGSVEPTDPVAPETTVTPAVARVLQPAVPVALAYPQNLLILNKLPDLRARVGDRHSRLRQNNRLGLVPAISSRSSRGESWGQFNGGRLEFDDATSEASLSTSTAKLQVGVDIPFALANGVDQILGINAWVSSANTEVTSVFGDGDIDTKGYGLAATGTWYFPNYAYVDFQAHYGGFESDLSSSRLGAMVTGNGGKGYALSVEGGRSFAMGANDWTVTPQAQLIWSKVDFDSFTTFGGTVEPINTESLLLRVGAAFDHEVSTGASNAATLLYAKGNLYYELLDDAGISFAGTPLISEIDRGRTELVLGGEHRTAGGKSAAYGELRLGTGLENFGDKLNVSAGIGLKVSF